MLLVLSVAVSTIMKMQILMFVVGASVALAEPATLPPAQQAGTYYAKGIAAEKAGDVEAARLAYTKALQLNPNFANCRYRLTELQLNRGAVAAKGREAKLDKVMVPVFQLDGATLQEALDALNLIIVKEAKGQVVANFVVQDPNKSLAAAKLTLNLKNLPASAVMKYLLAQANAKARYDEHAIVIEPK
jgi:tetratricopeptide (TPR) repeat protein